MNRYLERWALKYVDENVALQNLHSMQFAWVSLRTNITQYIIQYEKSINPATEEEFQLKRKQELIHHLQH